MRVFLWFTTFAFLSAGALRSVFWNWPGLQSDVGVIGGLFLGGGIVGAIDGFVTRGMESRDEGRRRLLKSYLTFVGLFGGAFLLYSAFFVWMILQPSANTPGHGAGESMMIIVGIMTAIPLVVIRTLYYILALRLFQAAPKTERILLLILTGLGLLATRPWSPPF